MEKLSDIIKFNYSDPEISNLLSAAKGEKSNYTVHFNQNEDSFIKCGSSFKVPSLAIHHDVHEIKPSLDYIEKFRTLFCNLSQLFPAVFSGTIYFFDPAEVMRPCFIQIFKLETRFYLYLLRLDLNIRLSDSRIVHQATNDATAEFETEKLYFENLLIPIEKPETDTSGSSIPLKRLFKSTWVGESGTGYHLNGQWIDHELTKMISALYLPAGLRTYPYYPFKCDFTTLCFSPAALNPAGRKQFLYYMDKSLQLIEPEIPDIETAVKNDEFSKDHPLFTAIKKKIPDEWTKIWSSLKISAYLNENDMREYILEFKLL